MKDLELGVQEIKELMEAFHRNKLGSLKIQQGEFVLKLEDRKVEQVFAATPPGVPTAAAAYGQPEGVEQEEPAHSGHAVTSPIVGTFYASPAPDKEPYVRVGDKVRKGDVLFIIESMKLMNEVTCGFDGTVSEIVVENGQGVEFGQPILYVE